MKNIKVSWLPTSLCFFLSLTFFQSSTYADSKSVLLQFENGTKLQFIQKSKGLDRSRIVLLKEGEQPAVLKKGRQLKYFQWHEVASPETSEVIKISKEIEANITSTFQAQRLSPTQKPTSAWFFVDDQRYYVFQDGTFVKGSETGSNSQFLKGFQIPNSATLVSTSDEKYLIESFGFKDGVHPYTETVVTRLSDGESSLFDLHYRKNFNTPSTLPVVENGFLRIGQSEAEMELGSLSLSMTIDFENEKFRLTHHIGKQHPDPKDGTYLTRLSDGKSLRIGFEDLDTEDDWSLTDTDNPFQALSEEGFSEVRTKGNSRRKSAKRKVKSEAQGAASESESDSESKGTDFDRIADGISSSPAEPKPSSLFKIDDGILSLTETPKKIDLRNFDSECARYRHLRNPSFKNSKGEAIDALEAVSTYTDLVDDARKNPLKYRETADPKIMDEIEKAIISKRSVVLLGKAGTGKSSAMRAFAREVAIGKRPNLPRTFQIFEVTPLILEGGEGTIGPMEQLLRATISVGENWNAAFFMDEIHSFAGVGTHSNKSTDILQSLKGPTASGNLVLIGTDTEREFNQAFGPDRPFYQRFDKIQVLPPTFEQLTALLKSWFFSNEEDKYRDAGLIEELVTQAAEISTDHSLTTGQPRAASYLLEKARTEQRFQSREQSCMITPEALRQACFESYQMSDFHFEPTAQRQALLEMPQKLNERIVGQALAKTAIVKLWQRYFAGVGAGEGVNAILLAGPSGVGKSYLAQESAKAMNYPISVINMHDFSSPGQLERFKNRLYGELLKNSHRLIVLDSFEHASIEVQTGMIEIFGKGTFETNLGAELNKVIIEEVNAKNALFIVTTGAGGNMISREYERPLDAKVRIVESDLKHMIASDRDNPISMDVLDRLRQVVPMTLPSAEEYRAATEIEVAKLLSKEAERIQKRTKKHVTLQVENLDKYLKSIGVFTDGTNFWAISSEILRPIEEALAERIIQGDFSDGETVLLKVDLKPSDVSGRTYDPHFI